MSCDFVYDDGAYVLGALAPAERAAYEQHLAGCPACREAVSNVAVLPGLLRRLGTPDSQEPLSVSSDRVPNLIKAVKVLRKRQRRKLVGAVLLAACVALLAGMTLVTLRSSPPAAPPVKPAMLAMAKINPDSHVTAEVGWKEVNGGVEIVMHCAYPAPGQSLRPYTFRLFALGSDGTVEQIGSWTAGAGDDVTITGTIRFKLSDVDRIELRGRDGTPLLVLEMP
ncbi:MAG TPA: anti-sigma factor [Micromonosporaceae bacterium]|nr:anti-sigma factor [Micromonosporaceae bacterium]HCU51766.1 anti-sigma factor [Micromonosporaceae bacterium]